MKITHASHLSPADLTAELSRLARCEREATAALIVHLAEFDRRRLYEPAGYSSLFKYCMAVLRLSEDAVYNRIEVARAAREHPVILEMLETGALSPTTARLLARHLTRENGDELLAAAAGKSKQAIEELLGHRFPQADVAARVRKLPRASATPAAEVGPMRLPSTNECPPGAGCPPPDGGMPADAPGHDASVVTTMAGPAPRHSVVRPLAPERYEIRFTARAETRERLREAQDLLGHAIPSGDLDQVFYRALTVLVADLQRRKCAITARSGRSRGQPETSPNIPAAVRRAVWKRDGGRCAFTAMKGHRCGERRFLEFHHVIPRGAGGLPTVENIQLRCRAHNGYEVDVFYGPGKRWMRGREGSTVGGSGARSVTRSGTSRGQPAGQRLG
jgi:hypothetical protein